MLSQHQARNTGSMRACESSLPCELPRQRLAAVAKTQRFAPQQACRGCLEAAAAVGLQVATAAADRRADQARD